MVEDPSQVEPMNVGATLNINAIFNDSDCGKNNLSPGSRRLVVGGENAKQGEYPWMGFLTDGLGACGGSLVGRTTRERGAKFLLTARHCLNAIKDVQVDYDLKDGSASTKDGEDLSASRVRLADIH